MGRMDVSKTCPIDIFFVSLGRSNIKGVFLQSLAVGFSRAAVFFIYSIAFSYGAFLVVEGRVTFHQIFQ